MSYLTPQEVGDAFRTCHLEENYNFLAEDLEQIAQAMVEAAAQKIKDEEKAKCVIFVKSLNTLVGQALEDFRGDIEVSH